MQHWVWNVSQRALMDAIKYRRAEVSDEGRENVETLGARF